MVNRVIDCSGAFVLIPTLWTMHRWLKRGTPCFLRRIFREWRGSWEGLELAIQLVTLDLQGFPNGLLSQIQGFIIYPFYDSSLISHTRGTTQALSLCRNSQSLSNFTFLVCWPIPRSLRDWLLDDRESACTVVCTWLLSQAPIIPSLFTALLHSQPIWCR